MEFENVSRTEQPAPSLSFADFFERNESIIDTNSDGGMSKKELIEAFGEKLASPEDTKVLDSLFENFDKVSKLDHWYSSTVNRADAARLDIRVTSDRLRMKECTQAMNYLRENFDDLVKPDKNAIYFGDIADKCSQLNSQELKEILGYVMLHFNDISNSSDDEYLWATRSISKEDIDEYERQTSDSLVNSARLFAGDSPDWIPGNVVSQRNRIQRTMGDLDGWSESERQTLKEIGYGMIEGDVSGLVEAVGAVERPEDLKDYAAVLDGLYNRRFSCGGSDVTYKVSVTYRPEDKYSNGKPALVFNMKDNFWLHIPADKNVKPTAWVEEKDGMFFPKWTEREQPPELAARYLSEDARSPEVRNNRPMRKTGLYHWER